MIHELVGHIENIKGYFLEDKRIINFVAYRPGNTDLEMIGEKVAFLSQNTQVKPESHDSICEAIMRLGIDQIISKGNPSLVTNIAKEISEKEQMTDFASKYCAAHWPYHYPLFNNHSVKVLGTICGTSHGLTDYETYCRQMHRLKSAYKMHALNFFEVSKLFWIYQHHLTDSLNLINDCYEQRDSNGSDDLHVSFKYSGIGSKII